MPPVGFEPTISAGERPQTYALDRAATRTGSHLTVLFCIWRWTKCTFAVMHTTVIDPTVRILYAAVYDSLILQSQIFTSKKSLFLRYFYVFVL